MDKNIKQVLKLKEIDQLDSAILQFSQNTITTKKIYASILIGIITIILKITDNHIDHSIYIASIITTILFWIIDSTSYFYQRKLRIKMTEIVRELSGEKKLEGYGISLNGNEKPSIKESFFNASQIIYMLGIFITIIVLIFDIQGYIKK